MTKPHASNGDWSLEFLWSLEVGYWMFSFPSPFTLPTLAGYMTENRESTRSTSASGNALKAARLALLGLFLVAIAALIAQVFVPLPAPCIWQTAALILAVASTLTSLTRQLPAQNVLLAAVIIGVISGGIHLLGSITGIPFGPVVYSNQAGPLLFNSLSWIIPFLWIVALLNSRGVARLVMRPWRKLRIYGYWMIGLTTVLTLLLDLGLEPFATRHQHYWLWQPTKLTIDWYGAPLSNFLGWLVTALLALAFATPSLMKKQPGKSGPDYHPLIVWTALNALFIAAAISQHFWPAAVVSAVATLAVIPFAILGAKW